MGDDFEVPGRSYFDIEKEAFASMVAIMPPQYWEMYINGEASIKRILEVYFSRSKDFAIEYVEDDEISPRHDAETDIELRVIYLRDSDMGKKTLCGRIILSIYHEMGHVLLGHLPYAVRRAARSRLRIPVFCSAEWQAEAFASAAAMPYPTVFNLIIDAQKLRFSDNFIINCLQSRYRVSRKAAIKRIENVRKLIAEGKGMKLYFMWQSVKNKELSTMIPSS